MAVQMSHDLYGTRTVTDEQVPRYTNLGWTKGGEVAPESVEGTVAEILADVGDDPQAASAALAAEQSRSTPRTSLVTALTRIAESTDLEV